MRTLRPLASLAALLVAAAGCDGGGSSEPPPPPPPPPPGAWTWIPLPGSSCSDGSETGIGINAGAGASPDVLVFLMGGGACWDYATCFLYRTATAGPYGQSEFEAGITADAPGSVLDRSLPGNPFADYTLVFIPYCTGDVHVGDTVQTYSPGGTWRHSGRVNLGLAFEHLGASLPAPAKVVVSGLSAGGFGSLYALDVAHATWPEASGYLVDDSGPPLDAIPQARVDAWYASWDMGGAITPLCGVDCQQNLSLAFPALAEKYPSDRLALLSSTSDATIRFFFGDGTGNLLSSMDPTTFSDSLSALAIDTLGSASVLKGRAFLVSGTSHTMLGNPAAFTSGGVSLLEWLRREVEDDASWATVAP